MKGLMKAWYGGLATWRGWRGIDNRVRQGCIMFPWLFNIYMDAMIKEGNEIHGRWKKVKIDWLFVCR